MPILRKCIEPGCSTLCIDFFCIKHESRPTITFPRGRPWPPPVSVLSVADVTVSRLRTSMLPARAREPELPQAL
jgi:hypothetical protein